jgi:hypothetical protein
MKKVILVFILIVFTCISAEAAQVFHDITGRPSYVSYGGGVYTRSINNWGTNAAFTPQNCIAAGERMRARRFARTYAQNMAARRGMGGYHQPAMHNVRSVYSTPSRCDKNYKISSSKSHTRNGITYFD